MSCTSCALHALCHSQKASGGIHPPAAARLSVPQGAYLFRSGKPSAALYAVRSGSLKCISREASLGPFVNRFMLPGDVTGLDGFDGGVEMSDAIALEASEVCEVPRERAQLLADTRPDVAAQLRTLASAEILRTTAHAQILSRRGAVSRVAGFLADLSARGNSATVIALPMGRRDIGDHLGLTIESVSRAFS
ncbi:MAG TPA: Crp/Fnr family transcriptional regulator, partial [Usitatibacter sp.]